MRFNYFIFRQVARFLVAALLLQAVLPAWAINKVTSGSHSIEICTSTGTKWIQTSSADSQSFPSSHDASQHCVFCSTTGASNEFNAGDFLSFHASQYQTALITDSDFIVQFLGHSKFSRAPPSHS
jgi:hypothetical protein